MMTLDEIIRAEIRASGAMRFDRFMEVALYHPGFGYYAKAGAPSPIGKSGDFFTSVSVGPLFGHLLARQFFQMWQRLGKIDPFWIIEQGAHDGQLACDILDCCRTEMPDLFSAIRYGIVQASGDASMRQRCAPDADLISRMSWFENLGALADEEPVGVFFSNELVDAFPIRAITYRTGRWLEQHVTIEDERLRWIDLPIEDRELSRAILDLPLPALEGYTTEINLRAAPWIAEVAHAMQQGYVLTIDYGHPASLYYAPFRTGGTLTAYVKHHGNDDVLTEPGMRDITAHVDFTALARAGENAGLTTLGFLDQQRFLMGVAHDELSEKKMPHLTIQQNLTAWNTLTHPDHLGANFFALIQAKDAPAQLDGLRYARPGGLFSENTILANDLIDPSLWE
jgi:SAM-dependent MidA family methyltransferase